MKQSDLNKLQEFHPSIEISEIKKPDGFTLNEFWQSHNSTGLLKLLDEKTSLISKPKSEAKKKHSVKLNDSIPEETESKPETESRFSESKLNIITNGKIGFKGNAGNYFILGALPSDLGNMRITLQVEQEVTGKKYRTKLDLFDFEQIVEWANELFEKNGFERSDIENDLTLLADELEKYRELQMEKSNSLLGKKESQPLTPEKEIEAIQFLRQENLMERLDELIEQCGVVGENNTRLLLFTSATSYKMPNPLHVIVQGSSSSGKTHLIGCVSSCFPQEDVIRVTRITPKSLYNYTDDSLMNKLFVIEDYDGLSEEAEFSFRELISAKRISSSTTVKDAYNNLQSVIKTVYAHFSSFSATTKAEVYYDNLTRSIVVGVDESDEQTNRIIQYQNRKMAGKIDLKKEQQARELLRNCVRVLKSKEVINPFADRILLPAEAKNLRRLNTQFQSFISQITLLHQEQRKQDDKNRLLTTIEDIRIASEILLDAIYIKTDDLDSSSRQFFEKLKSWLNKHESGSKHKFSQREVRKALNGSKTQVFRYFSELLRLEYITITEGSANRGYKYKVEKSDDSVNIKSKIKADLDKQLAELETDLKSGVP